MSEPANHQPTETAQPTVEVPARVGVLGGGRMGAGIAHAFLISGAEEVVVVDVNEAGAEAARQRIEADLQASLERGKITGEHNDFAARLTVSTAYANFARCGLVVEAVPEDQGLKVAALTRVEQQLGDDAYLATNTSSLSVSDLAKNLQRPDRFCGLHFFNPVPASKLVEVVLAEQTSQQLAEAASQWVQQLARHRWWSATPPGSPPPGWEWPSA